jgi:uncharacterized protein YdaU (DUF1376 family)
MEDLAYRRMLDWCYLHEKPLPISVEDIARVIRMRTHCDSIAIVLREFFNEYQDGWICDRVLEELEKVGDKSKKASASARVRWQKQDADAMRTHSEGNATQDTIHITQDTIQKKPKKAALKPEGFPVELWNDFLTLRNGQKKPLTETALKGLVREATKAGWTLEQAISHCCMKGWIGFDANWVKEKLSNVEQRQSAMSQLTRGLSTPKPFWQKPSETLEVSDAQRPRLL